MLTSTSPSLTSFDLVRISAAYTPAGPAPTMATRNGRFEVVSAELDTVNPSETGIRPAWWGAQFPILVLSCGRSVSTWREVTQRGEETHNNFPAVRSGIPPQY